MVDGLRHQSSYLLNDDQLTVGPIRPKMASSTRPVLARGYVISVWLRCALVHVADRSPNDVPGSLIIDVYPCFFIHVSSFMQSVQHSRPYTLFTRRSGCLAGVGLSVPP